MWLFAVAVPIIAWAFLRRTSLLRSSALGHGILILGTSALAGITLIPIVLFARRAELYYYSWYLVELPIVLVVIAGLAFHSSRRKIRWAIAIAAAVILCWDAAGLYQTMSRLKQWRQHDYEAQNIFARFQNAALLAALWGNANLPQGTRIGASNAGIQGYFSDHRVTNLDGLANIDIYERRLSGWSDIEYVRANNIEYLSDQIRGNGLFGSPFAHYEVLTAFPLALTPPGQFVVARIVDEPFPPVDIATAAPVSNVEFVQWRADPVFGHYRTRLMSIQPAHGSTRVTFELGQEYARFRALTGIWDDPQAMGEPGGVVDLRVYADGALVRQELFEHATQEGSPLTIDVENVNALVLEVRQQHASSRPGSFWLADVRFDRVETASSNKAQ